MNIPDLVGLKSKLIALAVVAVLIGFEEYRIKEKEALITTLTEQKAICEANVARLTDSIDRQNKAVEQFRAEKANMDTSARKMALAAKKKRVSSVSLDVAGVDGQNKFLTGLFQ